MSIGKTISIIFLLLFVFLTDCRSSGKEAYSDRIYIDYMVVEDDFSFESLTDDMVFEDFLSVYTFDFSGQSGKALLLRLRLIKPITESHSEYTFSLAPKYFPQVTYINRDQLGNLSTKQVQKRRHLDGTRVFSGNEFAFNIDDSELKNTHFFMIKVTPNKSHIVLNLTDTNSYIQADHRSSSFFTLIYSLILSMAFVNIILYFYNREKYYLFYALYVFFMLYALIWEEGKINHLPWLAWQILGYYTSMLFWFFADLSANLFFYYFFNIKIRQYWLAKIILFSIVLRFLLVCYLAFFHYFDSGQFSPLLLSLFNLSVAISIVAFWLLLVYLVFKRKNQAIWIFIGWSALIFSTLLRVIYTLSPNDDLSWMSHSFEVAVFVETLFFSLAIAQRFIKIRKQRDTALKKYNEAEQDNFKQQMITNFLQRMQSISEDINEEASSLKVKKNRSFHHLLNHFCKVDSSFLFKDQKLTVINRGEISQSILNKISAKLKSTDEHSQSACQASIETIKQKPYHYLTVPLRGIGPSTPIMILGLHGSKRLSKESIHLIQKDCRQAYIALRQASSVHKTALLAKTDAMTGCKNRKGIETLIQQLLQKNKPVIVGFIDIDKLKTINDSYGHAIGDQCIIGVSKLMKQHFNKHTQIGRVGGDEFLIVFSKTKMPEAEQLIKKFIADLRKQLFSELKIKVTSSIGLAMSRHDEHIDELLKRADQALYRSKEQGRDQYQI